MSPNFAIAPKADFILPFDLPKLGLRGRLTRLDAVASRALGFQGLPEEAGRVAAEAIALSALLGSALKLEGRLSIQAKGDGSLSILAADYFAGGGLRGYAKFDAAKLEAGAGLTGRHDFSTLVGKGAFAITIEPKPGAQQYQGLVSINSQGMAQSAEEYFTQSEQLPTMIKLAAGPLYSAGEAMHWRAGGLMVQAVPAAAGGASINEDSDDFKRVAMFLQTLEAVELLDSDLADEQLLWRLFHEDEIRVQPAQGLHFQCTCSADKVRPVLQSYPKSELPTLADADGVIRTRCEFCGTSYEFPLGELQG